MIIILSLLGISVLCFCIHWLLRNKRSYDCGWGVAGIVFGIIFAFTLIPVFPQRSAIRAEILKFKSVQTTLETARQNPVISELELAAIQQKVVESNEWLVCAQYWAKHPLVNWFWVQDVYDLEPIK